MNCTARVVFALCEPSALILRMFLFLAGILIAIGLMIELTTLLRNSPIGFLVFLAIGGAFIFFGVVVYLLALLSTPPESEKI